MYITADEYEGEVSLLECGALPIIINATLKDPHDRCCEEKKVPHWTTASDIKMVLYD